MHDHAIIPNARYASREWDRMWTRTGLLDGPCSDPAQAGDHFTYEIGRESIVVAPLLRGRRLPARRDDWSGARIIRIAMVQSGGRNHPPLAFLEEIEKLPAEALRRVMWDDTAGILRR